MATQVQFRRGTTTENNAFTGATAELTVDTTLDTLRVHDGSTAGGVALVNVSAAQTVTNKTFGNGNTWQGNAPTLAYGGTGDNLTAVQGGIVYSTDAEMAIGLAGTAGQVLTSGGTAAPIWVTPSSLTVGTASVATTASNIAGGSAGYIVYQYDTDDTSFIQPGAAGTFLRSTGASTAPNWATASVTYGTTEVDLGSSSTSLEGLSALTVTGTTTSTSTTTGAAIISGGVGIAENLNVGGNLAVTGTSTFTGQVTFNGGTITLGDSASDNVSFGADVDSSVIPNTDATYNLGSTTQQWDTVYTHNIGTTSDNLTINNPQVIFDTTDSIQIPVGTTAQRDGTPAVGQIRYNSTISSFEGYGPGNAWGSLGGVKDVDQDTYLLTEASAGSDEDTFEFFNAGTNTAALDTTALELKNDVYLQFDTGSAAHPSHSEGAIFYSAEYHAPTYYNDISGVSNQIGLEEWIRVKNVTGSTISNGTPVYITGASGETPTIAPADATTLEKARVIGVATHDIANTAEGVVTVRGLVSGIDTSALTAGQPVHVGADGSLQTAAPTAPYFPTDIGGCIVSDATDGYIYVRVREHSMEQLRVTGNTKMDGNLTVAGDLTVSGTQTITSQANLALDNAFIYMNSGDTIGEANTTFSGSGLDDAYFTGHFEGTTTTSYYVRIDGVGTGTGGVDTFEWSKDNWSTTEATGVDITGSDQALDNNINIKFNATTGHTDNDQWSGTAAPLNVDTGWASNRNTGTSGVGYTHLGVMWDTASSQMIMFDTYDPEIEGNIDTGHASFSYAPLQIDGLTATTGSFSSNGSFGGTLTVTGATTLNSNVDLNGNLDVSGTSALTGNVTVTGDVAVNGGDLTTTASTFNILTSNASTLNFGSDTSTVNVGNDVVIAGNLTVQGSTTQQASNQLLTSSTLVHTGDGNSANTSDIGVYGEYTSSGTKYAGFVKDQSDSGYWKIYSGATNDASSDVVDFTNATLDSMKMTNLVLSGDLQVNGGDITSSTGAISFGNENLSTTGTLSAGAISGSSLNVSTGAVTAGSLDISGNADIDGTMEADAYTVNGTTLSEYISDTVGAMFSSNTETGITVTYQDTDNTIDIVHNDTSSVSNLSSDNSGSTFIQDISLTFDTYGHVTGASVATGTVPVPTLASLGIDTDDDVRFDSLGVGTNASGTTGEIRATHAITSYYSDARLKEFQGTIDSALDKVMALNGYYFVTNDRAKELGYTDEKRQVGVSAQEVQAVMPEIVTDAAINSNITDGTENDYLTVHYDRMVPLLIEAIKEQQKQIDELKAKLGE
jgi:cytoskeletal protein CcmA (bactofilin family)